MARRQRSYTEELLTEAVAANTSVAGVLRYLGLNEAGGTHAHVSRRIKTFGIDTTHFIRWQSGGHKGRLGPEAILVHRPERTRRERPHMLRRALVETGRLEKCASCGIGCTWREAPLRLHVDHVNGDFRDNRPDNLRFLCPNCHSQTENFAGRSRGKFGAPGDEPYLGRPGPLLDSPSPEPGWRNRQTRGT